MFAKRSLKSSQSYSRTPGKLGYAAAATVLGVSLLLTFGNIKNAVNSNSKQQLIYSQSDSFASEQYQPIQFGSIENIAQSDLAEIDRLAKELNYTGSSVTELANLLAQHADTELEKARIIYAWVTQHVTYDVPAFMDAINNDRYPNVEPQKILRDRTTICSGFSNLYYALASAMNLEVVIVSGYAKGATPENDLRFKDVNHAWNSVKVDGAWYLLDATFGAGSMTDNAFVPKYQDYYFATPASEFISNHYPQDSGWQLLAQIYKRAEFDNLPNPSARFYDLGMELVSHHNYQITAANRLNIQLKATQDVVALASLTQNEQELTDNTVLVSRRGENMAIDVAPPSAGSYELTIYAKRENDLGKYGEVIKYRIEATNSTVAFPKTYSHFHSSQASLIEPLKAELQSNWSTYFNLVVPDALDVQVVNTTTEQWTSLTGYGDYFAGHVEIQSGNIAVVAKFTGSDRYWQLLEYQSK